MKLLFGLLVSSLAFGQNTGNLGNVMLLPPTWVDVRSKGAVGDGIANDSASFQSAFDFVNAAGGGVVFVPGASTYQLESVTVHSNTRIVCQDRTAILKRTGSLTYAAMLYFNDVTGGSADPANNAVNISIENCTLMDRVDTLGFSEFNALLYMTAVTGVQVVNCAFIGQRGDGIYISGDDFNAETARHNYDIIIEKCAFDGINSSNRNGISVGDATNIIIRDNTFKNLTQAGMPGAINIESNFDFSVWRNILIENNTFSAVINGQAINVFFNSTLTTSPYGLIIRNNDFGIFNSSVFHFQINLQLSQLLADSAPDLGIVIECNRFRDIDGDALQLYGVRGVMVSGNTFAGPTSKVNIASVSQAELHASNVVLHGNTFQNTGQLAIGQADEVAILGNRFINPNNVATPVIVISTPTPVTVYKLVIANNLIVKGSSTATKAIGVNNVTVDPATSAVIANVIDAGYTSDLPPNYALPGSVPVSGSVPANDHTACTTGAFADDSSYHYACIATDTWVRVAWTAGAW